MLDYQPTSILQGLIKFMTVDEAIGGVCEDRL